VPIDSSLRAWAGAVVSEYFGSPRVVSRGRMHDVSRLPGLVALLDGKPVGYLGYWVDGADVEIVALVSTRTRRGVARALISELDAIVSAQGVRRIVLVTTNDNVPAQRFYRACWFRLVATYVGAVAESRRLKPEIPILGEGGVLVEDELEYARPTAGT
jgi:ribosomal protein S18 acetylase RimI-like enzyme